MSRDNENESEHAGVVGGVVGVPALPKEAETGPVGEEIPCEGFAEESG